MENDALKLITILGHTAGGKTSFAAHLAQSINAEIISADSRQVYRNMDIGTGKDIKDYYVNNKLVPYHLVDIHPAGYKYNVYDFQRDFFEIAPKIKQRNKNIVLCGGSGLYVEAIIDNYRLLKVPENEPLREKLEKQPLDELINILKSTTASHNTSDCDTKERAIKAIEIAKYYNENPELKTKHPEVRSLNFGIKFDRDSRRRRITKRLHDRLKEGMVQEVEKLLDSGISPDTLMYYGLEYRFLTMYLIGNLKYDEMVEKLNTAIHQFAKRQMTWFRKMEKKGIKIYWLDGYAPMDEKLSRVYDLINKNNFIINP